MAKKICNIASTIILIILIVSACILILPNVFGYKVYAVLSGSMEPQYHVGGLVFVDKVKADEIKVNDSITFSLSQQDGAIATHRVVSINTATKEFTTKGDANEIADTSPVPFNNLIGRAATFSVPYYGYFSIFIKTKQGILTAGGAIIVIMLLLFLPDILIKDPNPKIEELKHSD